MFTFLFGLTFAVAQSGVSDFESSKLVEITAPPKSLAVDAVYKKYISADGYPIVATENVNDYALREAAYLVNLLLKNRPDVREAMVQGGSRMTVMAHNEFTTDLPEWKWLSDSYANDGRTQSLSAKDFWDARARGLGGSATDPLCSCAEENLLSNPGDPYSTECILIHEFAHNIHLRGLNRIDPGFDRRLQKVFESAMKKGLWSGLYASVNHHEYFAEGVQSWFDNNRENDHDHNHVNTRQELEEYDPDLAAICWEVFGTTKLKYTKPTDRLVGHLSGYDPSNAPRFEWPIRLQKAHLAIHAEALERNRKRNDK